jgi:hypothetical protein
MIQHERGVSGSFRQFGCVPGGVPAASGVIGKGDDRFHGSGVFGKYKLLPHSPVYLKETNK